MSGFPNSSLINTPDWGANLPQREWYETDDEYNAALADFYAATGLGDAAFAPPSFDPVTGFSIAGDSTGRSVGQVAANPYNRLAKLTGDSQMDRFNALALNSRVGVRPDEAATALAAFTIDPETGTPISLLNPLAANELIRLGVQIPDKYVAKQPVKTNSDGTPIRVTIPGGGLVDDVPPDVVRVTIPGGGLVDSPPNLSPPSEPPTSSPPDTGLPPGYYDGDPTLPEIPQEPIYPEIPQEPLGFQGLSAQTVSPALYELQAHPERYPQWVHDALRRRRR